MTLSYSEPGRNSIFIKTGRTAVIYFPIPMARKTNLLQVYKKRVKDTPEVEREVIQRKYFLSSFDLKPNMTLHHVTPAIQ